MSVGKIAQNLEVVREKVSRRCLRNGVDPAGITIVGVTKTFPAEIASAAVKAGLADLAENRVQEAAAKIPLVMPRPRWHLVGHLQKNKVGKAVQLFDVIQSVDSLQVAQSMSNHAAELRKTMEIYLQVNSSREPQKSGYDPAEIFEAAQEISALPNLKITGLMTIGPLTEDLSLIEKSFSLTRMLFERLQKSMGDGFVKLSMGISADYELALDHGANVLRIGTAIFGPR